MSSDEIAFYDAVGVNDTAVKVLGDDTLRKIGLSLAFDLRIITGYCEREL